MVEPDGDGESVLSSVILSGCSVDEEVDEPEISAERREDPDRPRAADR